MVADTDTNSMSKHKSPPSSPIPWSQVVRGNDSEANSSTSNLPEKAVSDNVGKIETEVATAVTAPIIGGEVLWPALSECTRPNSSKSASVSQGPVVQQSSPKQSSSQKQDSSNSHSNSSNLKHHVPGRQRSMKHRGGGGGFAGGPSGPAQSGFSRPPPPPPPPLPPPFPIFEMHYGNLVPALMEPPIGGPRPAGGVMHLPQIGPNHSSPRRDNSRARPQHHQDRRDVHLPYQFAPRHGGFIPPTPPGSPPILSPPVRFDMAPPFMYIPPVPGMSPPPPPPMLFPINPHLPNMLLNQIDYYFSDTNLEHDHFLKSNMDSEGWVSINLIANFPRVINLTNNVLFILDCLKSSKVVEVLGDKIRRRDNWKKFLPTHPSTHDSGTNMASSSVNNNALETTFERVTLNESTTNSNSEANTKNEHIAGESATLPEPLSCPSEFEVVHNSTQLC